MKLLVVLAAVALFVWLWRSGRRAPPATPPPASRPALPEAMVRCEHCGLHLPRGDALVSRDGTFCGPAHQRLGRDPDATP